MYVIAKTGGRQYVACPGDVLKINKIPGNAGDSVELSDILLVNDGKKTIVDDKSLSKAKIVARLMEQKKDDKILVFKKKRRQNYRRKVGHRQEISILKIEDILIDGKSIKA